MENGRLAYYRQAANPAFWDEHWAQKTLSPELYARAERYGTLPVLQKPYQNYLPPGGRILEAGCGVGDMVAVLRALGFAVEGVEAVFEVAGFELLAWAAYDGYKGLKDELPWLKRLFKVPKIGWRLERFIKQSAWLERHFGHMTIAVLRKPTA
jgi:hypothetical protein